MQFENGDTIEISNEVIISSLPLTLTAKFLGHHSPLKFRGICSVYLAYNKPHILPEGVHWLYYGSEDIDFNRVTESKKMAPAVAPKNKTYLTIEITYSPGDNIDSLSEKELIERISKQVEQVGLANKNEVIASCINKEGFVYPVNYSGYQEDLATAKAVVEQFSQLYSIGTGGDYNYADSQVLFHKAFDLVSVLCGKDSQSTQVIKETPMGQLNRIVKLGDRLVGDGQEPFIIAEAGMNHNGSLALAKQLVDTAKQTGCHAIKFQSFLQSSRVSSKVKTANYAETVIGLEETLSQMFDRLAMSFKDQKALFEYARKQGINIFSTPFDQASVDFLESINVSLYKIASMDITNLPLIHYDATTGNPII